MSITQLERPDMFEVPERLKLPMDQESIYERLLENEHLQAFLADVNPGGSTSDIFDPELGDANSWLSGMAQWLAEYNEESVL